jgi:hypothetical protein
MNLSLEEENEILRLRVESLERELAFLQAHTSIAQGMRGESLIIDLAGGAIGSYASQHDITLRDGTKVEVKFSKLNIPNLKASTKRWNWSKPLGWKNKGKSYDLLLLVGEKDERFKEHDIDDSPYVFFLVPYNNVPEITTSGAAIGSNVQLVSNFLNLRSEQSLAIRKYQVSEPIVQQLSMQKL